MKLLSYVACVLILVQFLNCAKPYCKFRYTMKGKEIRHPFCNVDCLRSPKLCPRHRQLEITQKDINDIVDSLNTMRQQVVKGELKYKVTTIFMRPNNVQKFLPLEKGVSINLIVSLLAFCGI